METVQSVSTYYEMHVTYLDEPRAAFPAVEGWKPSRIDGDIDLGEGTRHYLTKHAHRSTALFRLKDEVDECARKLREMGKHVVRTKVEDVLYDNRTWGNDEQAPPGAL